MAVEEKLKQLYFSHDIFADKDEKIIKMFYHFRTSQIPEDVMRRNFFHASFGLYWEIVQYMHRNELSLNDIPMLADELRTDVELIETIIKAFGLFRIEDDGRIISDRILRNLSEVTEKSSKAKKGAEVRWLLSQFGKDYEEMFGEKPILSPEEIEKLKKYSASIPELKEKMRDVLYTLKNLKFDSDINFKPCANWLLAKNNLIRLLNGEFGALRHKKTKAELKEIEDRKRAEEELRNQPSELDLKISACETREGAMSLIAEYYADKKFPLVGGRVFLFPSFSQLAEKFGITNQEIKELCQG